MQRGVAYKKLNQQVSIKHTLYGQKLTKNKGVARLSGLQCQKFDVILMICARGFGLCPLLEVILYRLLSFGSELAAIGGMEFVHCTEMVCLLESPLLEVSLYCF